MKKIPMVLTCSRIVCSVTLLFLEPLSIPFYAVYAYCVLSDILDGFLARKLNAESPLGSRLDSAADLVLVLAVLAVLLPKLQFPVSILAWISGILLVKFAVILTALFKYRKLVAGIHTLANKLAGLALCCYPFLLGFTDAVPLAYFACFLASIASLEEWFLLMGSKTLDTDAAGLWIKK